MVRFHNCTGGGGRPRASGGRTSPSRNSWDSGYMSSSSSSHPATLPNSNQRRIVFGQRGASSGANTSNSNTQNNNNNNSSFPSPSSTFSRSPLRPPRGRGRGSRGSHNASSSSRDSGFSSFGSSQSQPRPSWGGTANGSEDQENAIVCNCNEDAIMLTVRKEGPNTGKNARLEESCVFFFFLSRYVKVTGKVMFENLL